MRRSAALCVPAARLGFTAVQFQPLPHHAHNRTGAPREAIKEAPWALKT